LILMFSEVSHFFFLDVQVSGYEKQRLQEDIQ
jgi:hypothetical protein